ncbi:hypothetical protein JOC54_001850 [Alkalihalobacillus xiaoxiensis]|uniref:Uncharacterized protein n=1 Tax=Shouchella xiaoxiensis TaxID=766895 RepID=A0ABS2SSV1_9BACI|nr:hypothetical protein [Shouchella xiaoxiensis]MBM7838594.1 hypothetical protein [Shouchella xiaoxiensis]
MAFEKKEQERMAQLYHSIWFAHSEQERKRWITKRALLEAQIRQNFNHNE